jgi:hypothetical protein
MKTSIGRQNFEKLVLIVGIMVAIIAGFNASSPEEPSNISAVEVKVTASQEFVDENNCQFTRSRKVN